MSKIVYVVGIGCRRGCSAQSLQNLLQETWDVCGVTIAQIQGIASIDRKKNEIGLIELSQNLSLPLSFFSAAHLNTFSERISAPSATVLDVVGTASVAEACALALAEMYGEGRAELMSGKQKSADATCALARLTLHECDSQ